MGVGGREPLVRSRDIFSLPSGGRGSRGSGDSLKAWGLPAGHGRGWSPPAGVSEWPWPGTSPQQLGLLHPPPRAPPPPRCGWARGRGLHTRTPRPPKEPLVAEASHLSVLNGRGGRGWQGSRVKSGSDQIPSAGQVPATTKKLPLPARAPAGRQRWAVVPSAPVIQSLQIEVSSLPPMQGSSKPNCPGRQAQ